jgi:cation diffusion facilitator family transporter
MVDMSSTGNESANRDIEAREIQKLALFGFLINLGLAAIKFMLAIVSGSLAVTASAIDSGTDSIASLVLYGGLKISTRKTQAFPLGLYKIENVISVVVALFIFFTGYEIARHVLRPVVKPPDISLAVIIWLLGCTLVTFLFGQYVLAVGRRTESPTLRAEGRHRQADVLSSAVVLGSVVISYFGIRVEFFAVSLDHIAAAVVLIFITHAGWELLSDGMRVLLDASVDFDTLDRVRKIIVAEPMVIRVKSLVGRSAGRFRFLHADIVMRTDDLAKAHEVGHSIEEKIRHQVPHVERVTIHYEPRPQNNLRIALPLQDDRMTISKHFGESPYFEVVVLRLPDYQIENREISENPHLDVSRGKGIRVAEWLVDQKVDTILVKEELRHKGPGYVFANAGVMVSVVSADTTDEALAEAKF